MHILLEADHYRHEITLEYSDRDSPLAGVTDAIIEGADSRILDTLRACVGQKIKMNADGCSLLVKLHYVTGDRYVGYSVIRYLGAAPVEDARPVERFMSAHVGADCRSREDEHATLASGT